MGNCMETSKDKGMENGKGNEEGVIRGMEFIGGGGGGGGGGGKLENFVKDVKSNKNGLRVKMVLTKEELQWLMVKLKDREESGKRIEDVLEEIENGRKKGSGGGHVWTPSLDSIIEIPELLEMNR